MSVDYSREARSIEELTFVRSLPLTRGALVYASDLHGGQRRDGDGAPFLLHPLEAAALLARADYPDQVIAAAVLHDVLEDTDADRAELETRFGAEVAELVALVSDDPSIEGTEEQKDDVRARVARRSSHAAVVYAADKVSKVRELRMLMSSGALEPDELERKHRRYWKALEMLEQTIPGSRIVDILRFELEVLELLPPERGS